METPEMGIRRRGNLRAVGCGFEANQDQEVSEIDRREGDPGFSDVRAMTSRCSVRLVHEVVCSFDERKRQIVKDIGFGGILNFPPLKQINRRFSVWLMSRVDVENQTLLISPSRRVRFCKEDVALVFGIPCGGRRVVAKRIPRNDVKDAVGRDRIGEQFIQCRSIRLLLELLERPYEDGMSKDQVVAFKTAFVVFVMSCVLAPLAKYDHASVEYWSALVDAESIHEFDWAGYVIQRMLDSVDKLKRDLGKRNKVTNLTGCSLFLQVFYLDSVDLGALNLCHDTLPRIRHFNSDRIRCMISADGNIPDAIRVDGEVTDCSTTYNNAKVRRHVEVCYQWARECPVVEMEGDKVALDASSKYSTGHDSELHIPREAAGPVSLVFEEYLRQMEIQRLKFVTAALSIVRPFVGGYSYYISKPDFIFNIGYSIADPFGWYTKEKLQRNSSTAADKIDGVVKLSMEPLHISCHRFCSIHRDTYVAERDISSTSRSTCCHKMRKDIGSCFIATCGSCNDTLPREVAHSEVQYADKSCMMHECYSNRSSVNQLVARAMSQFYMLSRQSKIAHCIDLNLINVQDVCSTNEIVCKRMKPSKESKLPWEIGFDREFDYISAARQFHFLKNMDTCNWSKMPWILHYNPKIIELMPLGGWKQFIGLAEVEMDLLDAFLRRLRQVDDELYRSVPGPRWRHYVESDFMAALLAGWECCVEASMREQFTGSHLEYDVQMCEMFFFPFLLEHRWVCYAWRMEDNCIFIFDPQSIAQVHSDVVHLHKHVTLMLKRAMHVVAQNLFLSWSHPWEKASVQIYDCSALATYSEFERKNRSGVLVAYFCRNFDGVKLRPPIHVWIQNKIDDIAALMISEVVRLGGNKGIFPAGLFI